MPTLTERERMLLDRIDRLEERLAALEGKPEPAAGPIPPPVTEPVAAGGSVQTATSPAPQDSPSLPGFLEGTTINYYFDSYYQYNFNRPVGRVNLLRAYDVLSNNFNILQTGTMVERATNPSEGRRLGMRLDLMFGQTTETLQGGAQNEPRPQVYRHIFQAYGRYVAPVGNGLTFDFGKWASALGFENNYTKDQINYSRSYLFHFLPFYHMGVRAAYSVNDKLGFQYWLVNGAQQTEDFNGSKSQNFMTIITPSRSTSWTMQYYFGKEQRDLVPVFNPGLPPFTSQPGLSVTPNELNLNGRFHVLDSYFSWNATDKLTFAVEGDYVINRLQEDSAPTRVTGGAAYLKYQFVPSFYLAGRFEYFSDKGGFFSGLNQALKEGTVTATRQIGEGFQIRGEFRRDFSNQPFFFTSTPGVLKKYQNTATVAFIWWFGGKQGPWI